MELSVVENILKVIKTSTDKSVVLKGLIKLRTDLIKDRAGIALFRQANGIPPMVRLLSKPHEKILEVVLSILGNCCVEESSCREALDHKVSMHLTTILKSIPNELIQCRACRLLGNIAKTDSEVLLKTHSLVIAESVCKIIDESSDVQTRIMAFRANRFLVGNPQYLKKFLQFNGFVVMLRILADLMKNEAVNIEEITLAEQSALKVGLKKNQHREKYFEEVARNLEGIRNDIFDLEYLKTSPNYLKLYVIPNERSALDLSLEILRCLLVMSQLQMSGTIWKSLSDHHCTFAPIVYFVNKDNDYRGIALKILSNFSKNPPAFEILSSADAVVAACDLLVSTDLTNALSEGERRHSLNIIGILSIDACHRAKIRRSGALRTLVALMRDSVLETEKTLVLYILNNFQYDNLSMDLMIIDGLIPALIAELNSYLTLDDEYYKKRREEKKQTSKKRKLPITSGDSKSKIIKLEPVLMDADSPSSSPRSYSSVSSPSSSRSISPLGNLSIFKGDADESDEESYSPVCSDDEDDDDDDDDKKSRKLVNSEPNEDNLVQLNTDGSLEIMKILETCQPATVDDTMLDKDEDDEVSQDVPALKTLSSGQMTQNTLDIIENLLYRVTLHVDKRESLCKQETINTILKAMNLFGTGGNFATALGNIITESKFFVQVVTYGVAHQLHLLTRIEEIPIPILETLSCVAESNYGKAELTRLLRSDTGALQKRAAIAVAYIIKSQRVLHQMLSDNSALSILLTAILSNNNDEYTVEAIEALTAMCRTTLRITVPKLDCVKRKINYTEYVEDFSKPLHPECDMTFIVHTTGKDDTPASTTTIEFNKKLLCDSSEVFHRMLSGDFRESKEGIINLHNYTPDGLRYFLNLIICQAQNAKFNIPPRNKYNALLEAFEMSRVYIIPQMEQGVLDLLIWFLDETNCLSVLEWSMKNYHAELIEMTVNYYLTCTLPPDVKLNLFRCAKHSQYSTEWFQMITDCVLEHCRIGF